MAGKNDARCLVDVRYCGFETRDSLCVRVAVPIIVTAKNDESVIYVISSARTPSLS